MLPRSLVMLTILLLMRIEMLCLKHGVFGYWSLLLVSLGTIHPGSEAGGERYRKEAVVDVYV
jgi:hypothetical protein